MFTLSLRIYCLSMCYYYIAQRVHTHSSRRRGSFINAISFVYCTLYCSVSRSKWTKKNMEWRSSNNICLVLHKKSVSHKHRRMTMTMMMTTTKENATRSNIVIETRWETRNIPTFCSLLSSHLNMLRKVTEYVIKFVST